LSTPPICPFGLEPFLRASPWMAFPPFSPYPHRLLIRVSAAPLLSHRSLRPSLFFFFEFLFCSVSPFQSFCCLLTFGILFRSPQAGICRKVQRYLPRFQPQVFPSPAGTFFLSFFLIFFASCVFTPLLTPLPPSASFWRARISDSPTSPCDLSLSLPFLRGAAVRRLRLSLPPPVMSVCVFLAGLILFCLSSFFLKTYFFFFFLPLFSLPWLGFPQTRPVLWIFCTSICNSV